MKRDERPEFGKNLLSLRRKMFLVGHSLMGNDRKVKGVCQISDCRNESLALKTAHLVVRTVCTGLASRKQD